MRHTTPHYRKKWRKRKKNLGAIEGIELEMWVSFPSNGRTDKRVALDLVDKQGQATPHTLNPRHPTQHSREKEKESLLFIYILCLRSFWFLF